MLILNLWGVTWRYGGYRRLGDNGRSCHISSQTMGVRSPDKRDYIRSSGSPTSISGRHSEVGATQIDAGGMRPELEADAELTLTAGGPVLAEARNEEYSRISPAAGLALLDRGSSGTRRVGGSSFHGHPMLRSGAARNLGPMNHFPRARDTQTSRDLAPENLLFSPPLLC